MREQSIWEHYGYAYMMTAASLTACASLFNRFTGLGLWEPMVIFLTFVLAAISMTLCHYWKQSLIAFFAVVLAAWIGMCAYAIFHIPDAGLAAAELSGSLTAAGRMREMLFDIQSFFEKPYMQLMAVVLAGGIGIYALQKSYTGRIAIAGIILLWLVFTSIFDRGITKTAAAMGTVYLFMALTETLVCRKFSKQQPVGENAISWLAPVFVIAAALLCCMPVSEKPIQWIWVRQTWQSAKDAGEELHAKIYSAFRSDSLDFKLKFTGFSSDGHVGGNVKSSDGKALSIGTPDSELRPLYLVGTVKNRYTQDGWEQNLASSTWGQEEYSLDLLEFLYACKRNGTLSKDDGLAAVRNLSITYEDMYTKTLFYPEKMGEIQSEKDWKLIGNGSELEFVKMPRRGYTYEVNYLEPNYASSYVDNLLWRQEGYVYGQEAENADRVDEKEFFKEIAENYSVLGLHSVQNLEGLLKRHANYVYSEYTKLPENVPERVGKLAAAVTATAESDYDKMKAIELFLSRYEYTLSPGTPPEEKDVVDYFLMESGSGYCTYFASAMAVLGRAVGIPTRYVQGFIVFPEPGSNQVQVLDSNAHAWTEAYLQGVGWIPFEPSTGFSQYRYCPWAAKTTVEYVAASGSNAAMESGGDNDYEHDLGEEDLGMWDQAEHMDPELWEQLEMMGDEVLEEEESENSGKSGLQWYIGTAVCIFLLILTSSVLIRGAKRERIYRKAGYGKKLYMDMETLFAIWEAEGHPIKAGETFHDYTERLSRSYPDQRKKLAALGSMYTDIRYGQRTAGEDDQKEVEHMRSNWMIKLQKQRAWRIYLKVCKKLYFS